MQMEIEPGGIPVFRPEMDQFCDFQNFLRHIDIYGAKYGLVIPPKKWRDQLQELYTVDKMQQIVIPGAIKQHFHGSAGLYTQMNIPLRKRLSLKAWKSMCESTYSTPSLLGVESQSSGGRVKRKLADEDSSTIPGNSFPPFLPSSMTTANNHTSTRNDSFQNKVDATVSANERTRHPPPDSQDPEIIDIESTDVQPSPPSHNSSQKICSSQKIDLPTSDCSSIDPLPSTASTSELQSNPNYNSNQFESAIVANFMDLDEQISVQSDSNYRNGSVEANHPEFTFVDSNAKPLDAQCENHAAKSPISSLCPSDNSFGTQHTFVKKEISSPELPQNGHAFEVETIDDFLPARCAAFTRRHLKQLERSYWRSIFSAPPIYGADIPGSLFNPDMNVWNVANLPNLLNQVSVKLPGVNTPYLYFGMWKATFAWHVEDMDLYSINYIHFGASKQWYVIPPEFRALFEKVCKDVFPQDFRKCSEFMRHKTYLFSPTFLSDHNIPFHRCVQEEGEFMLTFPHGYHAGYNIGFNCAESVNFALDRWISIGMKAKSCTCVPYSVKIDVQAIFDPNGVIGPKAKLPVRAVRKPKKHFCVLCGSASGELLPAAPETPELQHCHRICAQFVPETTVENEMVHGIDLVPKARWRLSCKFCHNQGACIQCVAGRCVRSFHTTCAAKHNLYMVERKQQDAPTLYEAFCSVHDPRNDGRRRLMAGDLSEIITNLDAAREKVWARWSDGWYYPGLVKSDFRDNKACMVEFYEGYVKLISYFDLSFELPSDRVYGR